MGRLKCDSKIPFFSPQINYVAYFQHKVCSMYMEHNSREVKFVGLPYFINSHFVHSHNAPKQLITVCVTLPCPILSSSLFSWKTLSDAPCSTHCPGAHRDVWNTTEYTRRQFKWMRLHQGRAAARQRRLGKG